MNKIYKRRLWTFIEQKMQENGIKTQLELAELTGYERTTINGLSNSYGLPNVYTFKDICTALKLTPSECQTALKLYYDAQFNYDFDRLKFGEVD